VPPTPNPEERTKSTLNGTKRTALAAIASTLILAAPPVAVAGSRPFSDWLSAQGQDVTFWPPEEDYVGWFTNPTPAPSQRPPDTSNLFALVDYAGIAAEWLLANGGPDLGTEVDGTINERMLSDGRAEVHVTVITKNALTFVTDKTDVTIFLFGYTAPEILADPTRERGLSSAHFELVFTNTAPGAPLPDFVDAFILGHAAPGQQLVSTLFSSNGTGPLRSAFGVPEGTPGSVKVTQMGILFSGLDDPNKWKGARQDGFPVETIELHEIGH